MPVKLFPQLRLLKPTLPVTRFPLTMKPGVWVQPSHRVIPVFSRVFPLRLRYSGGRALHLLRNENGELGVRRFSTRHLGKEARRASSSSKSLIEDEAELSDWVSDLRTDSFRGQLTSEDEASDVNRVRNRTRDRDSKGGRESICCVISIGLGLVNIGVEGGAATTSTLGGVGRVAIAFGTLAAGGITNDGVTVLENSRR